MPGLLASPAFVTSRPMKLAKLFLPKRDVPENPTEGGFPGRHGCYGSRMTQANEYGTQLRRVLYNRLSRL